MVDFDRARKMLERGTIEVAPLAFMRGRTLNDSFVILDEAQNTTPEQMKMFLTRLGYGSKAVITGDVTQIDLPAGKPSGLKRGAARSSRGIDGIRFVALQRARRRAPPPGAGHHHRLRARERGGGGRVGGDGAMAVRVSVTRVRARRLAPAALAPRARAAAACGARPRRRRAHACSLVARRRDARAEPPLPRQGPADRRARLRAARGRRSAPPAALLGDVVISLDTARRQARERGGRSPTRSIGCSCTASSTCSATTTSARRARRGACSGRSATLRRAATARTRVAGEAAAPTRATASLAAAAGALLAAPPSPSLGWGRSRGSRWCRSCSRSTARASGGRFASAGSPATSSFWLTLYWIPATIARTGGTSRFAAVRCRWRLVAAALALYPALFAAGLRYWRHASEADGLAIATALWVGARVGRATLLLPFPWDLPRLLASTGSLRLAAGLRGHRHLRRAARSSSA